MSRPHSQLLLHCEQELTMEKYGKDITDPATGALPMMKNQYSHRYDDVYLLYQGSSKVTPDKGLFYVLVDE